ncbi:MAG: cysteine hydrolase family protein [Candidatus Hydrothermarchaeota archaeon]
MKALLIIDMLKDFVKENAPLEVPESRNIINPIKNLIEKARKTKTMVIYICDSHREDDPEFDIWPRHCVSGTEGSEVIDELKPEKNDYIVRKRKYSGFFGTDLDSILREFKVEELIITGIVTNICVLYTSSDAVNLGYRITVPRDCVAGLNEEDHEWALKQIEEVLNGKILDSSDIEWT